MKFCKDCKHAQPFTEGNSASAFELARCQLTETTNLVTGITEGRFCMNERREGGECGVDGKRWEAISLTPSAREAMQ